MADNEPTQLMWGAGTGTSLKVVGEYDPGITKEIDRQIRNLPIVEERCVTKARELLNSVGSNNFEIVLSTERGGTVYNEGTTAMSARRHLRGGGDAGTTTRGPEKQRVRAYVAPANGKGIHEELSDAVLLKAAMGMAGK
jgi:hypothetical protein